MRRTTVLGAGALALGVLAAAGLAVRRARLEPMLVSGGSMRPTLDPGQRIAGRLEVDGAPVPEPYLAGPPTSGELELELGPAQYLVLGDHRAASTDGRDFGPVGADALLGLVRFAYWPPRRLRRRG